MKLVKYIIVFFVIGILQYQFLDDFYINEELISNITVFMSIIFGFYITSLAIFVTSSYVSSLYQKQDKRNKSATLLHTLVYNYKLGLTITLFSILYLILLQFIIIQEIDTDGSVIYLSKIAAIPFSFIVLFNFLYGYKMLSDLVKIIIQESKTPKK